MADQPAPADPLHPETHLTATRDPSNASNAPELDFRVIPEIIGDYRILALLGEGGMGTVYQAEQLNPQRIVALKVIRPGLSSDKVLRRFKREAEALGRLQHPGIAQIYEAGTADSGLGPQPYFAMEFIQGERLREYAMGGRLTTPERLALMVQVCEAVHHAHLRGIIHRDLKPGNILLQTTGGVPVGVPKVVDFGLARRLNESQSTQGIKGTYAYMASEQTQGKSDFRTDVYGRDRKLYNALFGRPSS